MDSNTDIEPNVDPKRIAVARRVVRFLLSRLESQSTIVSRSVIQNVIREASQKENCGRIPFSAVFQHINDILQDVFGYEMLPLPAKTQKDDAASKSQRYIVLNKLRPIPALQGLVIEKSESTYEQTLIDGEYNISNINTMKHDFDNEDLAFKGILSITLCIVLFSKNHILQQELFDHLQSFGVPTDGTMIPILNCSIDELLKTMDKREYLSKIQNTSDMQGDTVSYRVGRRTQLEFDLDSLVVLVQSVMGLASDQCPTLKEDISKNIADSYDVAASI